MKTKKFFFKSFFLRIMELEMTDEVLGTYF